MNKQFIEKITVAGALSLSMILRSGALTACTNNSIKKEIIMYTRMDKL